MNIFITGTAGFIGFHLARLLLDAGHEVHGYDGMTDYYDVSLKRARHAILREYPAFIENTGMLEDDSALQRAVDAAKPQVMIHLAAQAGVRYSLQNPRAYIDANIIGTFNVLECAREQAVRHLLMASTSSVYGANSRMPYAETDRCDWQMSFYAATKKATEAMSHSHAHLYGIPTTLFRFFTVYGPWGRPDMALFKFTKAILAGEPIDVYNHGDMWRDFTYIDDLVRGIALLIDVVPPSPQDRQASAPAKNRLPADAQPRNAEVPNDSLSPVAPWRVVNIGNSDKVRLLDFIKALEDCLGRKAQRHDMEMQAGDVPATWADASLLHALTGYRPKTDIGEGVARFVEWYRRYYARPYSKT